MQIHWHEGLFLQAHHLQRSQKGLADAISAERRLTWAYPYGVIEARLNPDDLETCAFALIACTRSCRAGPK